jgi:hypothetical protein
MFGKLWVEGDTVAVDLLKYLLAVTVGEGHVTGDEFVEDDAQRPHV